MSCCTLAVLLSIFRPQASLMQLRFLLKHLPLKVRFHRHCCQRLSCLSRRHPAPLFQEGHWQVCAGCQYFRQGFFWPCCSLPLQLPLSPSLFLWLFAHCSSYVWLSLFQEIPSLLFCQMLTAPSFRSCPTRTPSFLPSLFVSETRWSAPARSVNGNALSPIAFM